ncbi:MAG: hypothetical protein AB7U62_20910 [Pseudolabrys sp.]
MNLLGDLKRRADVLMESRPHDFTIGPAADPYMLRWHIARSRVFGGCYLHHFLRSDDDRALHDHPWPSLSLLLDGVVQELYAPRGTDPSDRMAHRGRVMRPGSLVYRRARFAHRVCLVTPTATTLFLIGPEVREWGFWCPQGWRRWQDYVLQRAGGNERGGGCG